MKFYVGRKWNPRTRRIGRRVYYDLRAHQTLLGPTSCGKGATIEIPNLLRLKGVSVLSLDATGQNYATTHRWRGTFSDVLPLNPFNLHGVPDTGFNPLRSVHSFDDAAAIGECLQEVKDDAREPLWQESSADFLTGLCWLEVTEAKAHEGRTPTLENVFGMLTGDYTAAAKRMVASNDFQLASCGGRFTQDNRTNQGILATAIASTRWLRSEAMRRSLSVDEGIDWARLKGPRPLSVYAILDADKLTTVGPGWLRLVTVCALNTLYRLGGTKGLTTVFMLSEMAQLGHLKPVLAALGQGRKYGIRLAPMVWQDTGQMARTYGPHGATTIIGNSGCLLSFAPGPCDNDTAAFLSKAAGSQSVPSFSLSDEPATRQTRTTVGENQEPLWPPEMIRSLPEFHGLVWTTGKARPQPVYCPPYWDKAYNRDLAGRYDADPYHPAKRGRFRQVLRQTGRMMAVAALLSAFARDAVPVVPKIVRPAPHPAVLHHHPPSRR